MGGGKTLMKRPPTENSFRHPSPRYILPPYSTSLLSSPLGTPKIFPQVTTSETTFGFIDHSFPEEAVLSPCNFTTTHLTACILIFYLPPTSRPMKWQTLRNAPAYHSCQNHYTQEMLILNYLGNCSYSFQGFSN